MKKTSGNRNLLVRPPATIDITADAKAMIDLLALQDAVAAVKASVGELARQGVPIKQTVLEKEVDPEIANRQVLAVTVWLNGVTAEYASSVWKSLRESIQARKALLSHEDQKRLHTFVAVGVDVE